MKNIKHHIRSQLYHLHKVQFLHGGFKSITSFEVIQTVENKLAMRSITDLVFIRLRHEIKKNNRTPKNIE